MKQFEVVRGIDATEVHLAQAVALDQLVFEEPEQGIYDNCLRWFQKNPNIYTFLTDPETNEVVAYVNSMPISDSLYDTITIGGIYDALIQSEDILVYEDKNTYSLYFCSFVVSPEYQGTQAFSLMYDAYLEELITLTDKQIYIDKVIVQGATERGARVCRLSGMDKLHSTVTNTVTYELDNISRNFKPLSSVAEKLQELYMQSTE